MTEKENMHGHCHNHGTKPMSKYEEALGKYNTEISDDEVREAKRCTKTTTSRQRNSSWEASS